MIPLTTQFNDYEKGVQATGLAPERKAPMVRTQNSSSNCPWRSREGLEDSMSQL